MARSSMLSKWVDKKIHDSETDGQLFTSKLKTVAQPIDIIHAAWNEKASIDCWSGTRMAYAKLGLP